MPEVSVGYFLEDIAQEGFLTALVARVACEAPPLAARDEVLSATGGAGVAVSELRRFLRDCRAGVVGPFGLLVVAIDTNCRGYSATRRQVQDVIQAAQYGGPFALALPEPHIERWYLIDPPAFASALGVTAEPATPSRSCRMHQAKRALAAAFGELRPPLGGVEFAPDIVPRMDLYRATQRDRSFRLFVEDLRQGFAPYRAVIAAGGRL